MSKEKAPAYQHYPKDILSDINYQMMNWTERGMYRHLIDICWLEGSIPSNPELICRILQIPFDKTFEQVTWLLLGRCFRVSVQDSNTLVHPRLELERIKQAEWKAKCAKGGRASAHKPKHQKNINTEQSSAYLLSSKRTVNGNSSSPSSIASAKITPKSPKGDLCEIGKTCNGKFEECGKAFERFWIAYPRHDPPRKEARKSWCRKYCEGIDVEKILIWITEARNRWTDKKYIPQPTTWLNQRRWEGDLPPIPDEIRPKQRDILDDLLAQAEKEEHG